jgi:hypothetical protein
MRENLFHDDLQVNVRVEFEIGLRVFRSSAER